MGIEQFLLIALLNVTATEIGGNTLFKGLINEENGNTFDQV